jgi:hypothetical protein
MIKVLLSICLIICYNISVAQNAIVEKLPKGNFPVGFSSTVALDYAQNYPYCLDSTVQIKKYPKPLIINTWYPAVASATSKPMARKEYFSFQSSDKNIVQWVNSYRDYTENTAIQEWFGKKKSDLSAPEQLLLNEFLNAKTTAVKNIQAAKGKFPLIIYHQGAGASFEDNAILCEWLASQGYVVIGCSFQSADGEKLASHGQEESLKDVAFLLSFAQKLSNVDWMHAAMIGHSLGGQTINYIAAQGNMPFDAMVSLETTQEYYIGEMGMWPFITYVTDNAQKVNGAFLFASKPYAIHDAADKMINADRYYLTIPDIEHNDFISQGIQKKYLKQARDKTPEAVKAFQLVNEQYTTLCTYVLSFLNKQLKDDKKNWNNLLSNPSLRFGYTPFIEEMAKGKTKDMYVGGNSNPPTPRQLKFLIEARKIDTVVNLVNKFWHKDSKEPIYDPTFIHAVANHLLTTDTIAAGKIYKAYKALLGSTAVNTLFVYYIRLFSRFGLKGETKIELDKLLTLDPGNLEEVNQLKEKYLKQK